MNQLNQVACFATTALLTLGAASYCLGQEKALTQFGVVTDFHHTNKQDTPTRKYSAALPKSQTFIETMNRLKTDFVIELGDFVDTLAEQKDPAANLAELEKEFTSFNGPSYHVLGNHEFDNVTRDLFLGSITNTEIPPGRTFYSWDNGGVHFIVLDAGYTNNPPHRPFDMNTPEDDFWNWKDAYVPAEQIQWLTDDLAASNLPTVVFTHQTMDRVDDQDHNIKNASEVRSILENDGQVLAVFSGHDHQGGYANIRGIHYVVLNGNVGVNDDRTWEATSRTEGFDVVEDNQFALIEIGQSSPTGYTVKVKGYGRQPSYDLERQL